MVNIAGIGDDNIDRTMLFNKVWNAGVRFKL